MKQWDFNVIFYRVLCVTLLATAFMFTVILTNIFVDFDGFFRKNKQIPDCSSPNNNNEIKEVTEVQFIDNDDKSYETDRFYRTRRSVDQNNLQLHVKDPALKKILTSRLASLLKELDEEETTKTEVDQGETTTVSNNDVSNDIKSNRIADVRNEDLFHLAMHNILLQGMIGHMDLNDVYKKVHILVNNFNNNSDNNEDKNAKLFDAVVNSKELALTKNMYPYNGEHNFFDEIIKCKQLKNQIQENKKPTFYEAEKNNSNLKEKVYIKAIIEINENGDKLFQQNSTNSTQNIEGVIRLLYNGKPIRVSQMKETLKIPNVEKGNNQIDSTTTSTLRGKIEETHLEKSKQKYPKNPLINKLIEEYIKTHSYNDYSESSELKSIKTKRLKRQIKIRYLGNKSMDKNQKSIYSDTKKHDDDVYIEIETHFDSKGIKGEKKKKLVKSLIDKIQKALHSDIHETNKNIEHIKFVKRMQNSLNGRKHTFANKLIPSDELIEKRQLDPIDKTLKTHENINAKDNSWKKQVEGPRFLSLSKSVNSAEMSELDINYDTILRNGIPKRFQRPINTDLNPELENSTEIIRSFNDKDPNNVTLFLKDIDGSGFSIGINQFIGEPPDTDSMLMFNDIHNLIKRYHQIYDQDVSNESNIDKNDNYIKENNKERVRSINKQKVFKRSISRFSNTHNYAANNNEKISQHKIRPIKNKFYYHISNPNNLDESVSKNIKLIPQPFTSHREKRSFVVKKISNVKTKLKLSRYINTNAMARKKIFLKNKRIKRHVDKIRITTRDISQIDPKSDENIFFISRENSYSGKTAKEFKQPDTMINTQNEDHYDEIFPLNNYYAIHHNTRPTYSDLSNSKNSPNRLMSKYPHIFINDDSASKELHEDFNYDAMPYRIQPKSDRDKKHNNLNQNNKISDPKSVRSSETRIPKVDEIFNAILPPSVRANYKLTLKISPKNQSDINIGFKETHTSVNKSFDKNGLHFYSLLNVSQISKVEKVNDSLNNSKQVIRSKNVLPLNNELKEQKFQIKTLLQLHKKRVDQQLDTLLRERKHLEKMIEENGKNNFNKTVNILHDDILVSDANDKDDKMNKILLSIKKLQETYKTNGKNDFDPKETSITKKQIINNKSNEKITNEILNKIDTNTNILKAFLLRLSNNLKDQKDTLFPEKPREWNSNNNAFYVPNENINKTNTFAYKNNEPLPNTYYVNAKTVPNVKKIHQATHKNEPLMFGNNLKLNESKFFMDDFNNEFKIVPNKPYIEANIKLNTTNL